MTAPSEDAPAPEPQDDGLPALDPAVIEDEELLALAVDAVTLADPVARVRSAEIAMYQAWLQAAVEDAGTWRLYLEVESRQTEKNADVALVIARWAFAEGRRHPLPPTPPEGGAS